MADATPPPAPSPDDKSVPQRTSYFYEEHAIKAFLTLPGTRITYVYEANGRLVSIKAQAGAITTYTYCSQESKLRKVDKETDPGPTTGVSDCFGKLLGDVHHECPPDELLPDQPDIIQILPDDESDEEKPKP
jgi:YD repeat-containing protein